MVRVYRFGNTAAISTGGGPTRYIDADAARALSRALLAVARSIESESFTDSKCGTVEIPDYESYADIWKSRPKVHTVKVETYSLESGKVGQPIGTVYESTHKSPKAAARRLAEIINGKTPRAHELQREISGKGGKYSIDGLSLVAFRHVHGLEA